MGRKSFDEIVPYLKSCLCTLVPSEWYDNFPNVVLESYAYKKAVIATDFGSLPEMVLNMKTGLTFKYSDRIDLLSKLNFCSTHASDIQKMGENGFKQLNQFFLPTIHYETLISLFNSLTNSNKNEYER